MTDEQFIAHFEEFGKIVRDPVTNASRGFGFVAFVNENVARKLIIEL
jgi:RNA recognition motif-containing protein